MAMQESNGFLGMRRAFASDSESVLSFVPSREATCVVLIALSEAELTRSGKAVDLCYRSHPAPYLPLLLAAGNQEADIIVASGKLGLLTQPWCDVDPAVHAVVHDCLSTCQGSTGSNVREGNEQRVQAVPRQEQHPPARPFALGYGKSAQSWSQLESYRMAPQPAGPWARHQSSGVASWQGGGSQRRLRPWRG